METKKHIIWRYIKLSVFRTTLSLSIFLFLLIGGVVTALLFPMIQTKITHEVTRRITEALNFPVEIGSVDINWLDEITLKSVTVKDKKNRSMISVSEIDINFHLLRLFVNNTIEIEHVVLNRPDVRFINEKETNVLNINAFIDAITSKMAKDKSTGKSPAFLIDKIDLKNAYFSMNDELAPLIEEGFDHFHFGFDSIYAAVTDFKIASDTFQINVKGLKCFEIKTKLKLKKINTIMTLTPKTMEFGKLHAEIGRSIVNDSLAFKFDDVTDLADMINKPIIYMNLTRTYIKSQDLAHFAPYLKRYNETWQLTGELKGRVKRFKIKEMDLRLGKKTRVEGNIAFNGLPNFFETFIEANIKKATLYADDFKQYVQDPYAFAFVKKFNKVVAKGEFIGFPLDFVADGNFETAIGNINSDLNLKIKEKEADSYYKGRVTTVALNIGEIADSKDFGKLDMDGNIEGNGFSVNNAKFKLNASIARIGINQYDYRNIKTNAKFANQFFDGYLNIKDSNLALTLNGKVNLKNNIDSIGMVAHIDNINFKKLHLGNYDIRLRTKLNIKTKGLTLDKMVGNASFNDLMVEYEGKQVNVNSLDFLSSKINKYRSFEINSDLLKLITIGNFEFSQIYDDLFMFWNEYKLYFKHNEKETNKYYLAKRNNKHNFYKVNYDVTFKNINPIFDLFLPGFFVSKNTNLKGYLSNGEHSSFEVLGEIDKLAYKQYAINKSKIDFNTSKSADSTKVKALGSFKSESQTISNQPVTKDFNFEGIWIDNNIDFKTSFSHAKFNNYANIAAKLSFLSDEIQVLLSKAELIALDKTWQLQKENTIKFTLEDTYFNDFELVNEEQKLSLSGVLSKDPTKALALQISKFKLNTLNTITGKNLYGTTNGFIKIKDIFNALQIESTLHIDTLKIDNIIIGEINGNSNWNNVAKNINIDLDVYRDGFQVVDLYGTYDPFSIQNNFNITAALNRTKIKILESFLKDYATGFKGEATGKFQIKGSFQEPVIEGNAFVNDGGFKINYLNTYYTFSDYIYINDGNIFTKKGKFVDDDGHTAIISGGITHRYFSDFKINLTGDLYNFKLLNTSFNKDAIYYGTAVTDGDFVISGPFNNVKIEGNFISKQGTKIYIPLTWYSTVEEKDYISFTSKTHKEKNILYKKKKVDLSGIKLDLNLDITPEAYTEIIFDPKTGDIIKGNGYGKLKLKIDTKGDFEMFGDYTFNQGTYNFTFLNVVNKEFIIKPNSNIHWSGEAYNGIMDIMVSTEQSVSLAPCASNTTDSLALATAGRYPVFVNLNLKGELLKPIINLGIDIKTPTTLDRYLLDFKNSLQTNEQEVNKQVFSLLMLRSFVPSENSKIGSIASSATNKTLTELLSNQLNYWVSQVDPNFQVDINLNSLSAADLNSLKLRLQYSFLNGKLKAVRDGSLANSQNQTNATSIIGDVSLEYILNESGSLKIKAYTRPNQTAITGTLTTNNIQQGGITLVHSKSFDRLIEVIDKKIEEKKEN